jgi:enoyl-CoA hydratase/carnithine racemase
MNYALSQAKKSPQISIWDGVVMGGGVGVSIHGKYRVSTENTVFAMPETAIGLFPDVGCSYVFPRLTTPGLGLYLGLTGASIGPDDVCRSGLATHFIKSDLLESVLLELEDVPCLNPDGYVQAVLDKYATDPIPNKASLALHRHEDILR